MNFLLRSMVNRISPSMFIRRPLATNRVRRAFRSFLPSEQNRPSNPWPSRNSNSNPFGFFNEKNVVFSIIVANGLVFCAWQLSYAQVRSNLDQRLIWFMTKHFMVSWDGVIGQNRVWTLVTSAFSHFDLTHFLINNFVLYSFGPMVLRQIGLPAFVQLFLLSAVGCSLAHILYQRFYDRRPLIPAVGASGVTMGMTILYAFLRPFEPVLLFLVIPMPVVFAVGAFVAYDLYRAITHQQGTVGSAGHIGGALAGTFYYFWKIRTRL